MGVPSMVIIISQPQCYCCDSTVIVIIYVMTSTFNLMTEHTINVVTKQELVYSMTCNTNTLRQCKHIIESVDSIISIGTSRTFLRHKQYTTKWKYIKNHMCHLGGGGGGG